MNLLYYTRFKTNAVYLLLKMFYRDEVANNNTAGQSSGINQETTNSQKSGARFEIHF